METCGSAAEMPPASGKMRAAVETAACTAEMGATKMTATKMATTAKMTTSAVAATTVATASASAGVGCAC
jgi:hypothetical protein